MTSYRPSETWFRIRLINMLCGLFSQIIWRWFLRYNNNNKKVHPITGLLRIHFQSACELWMLLNVSVCRISICFCIFNQIEVCIRSAVWANSCFIFFFVCTWCSHCAKQFITCFACAAHCANAKANCFSNFLLHSKSLNCGRNNYF